MRSESDVNLQADDDDETWNEQPRAQATATENTGQSATPTIPAVDADGAFHSPTQRAYVDMAARVRKSIHLPGYLVKLTSLQNYAQNRVIHALWTRLVLT